MARAKDSLSAADKLIIESYKTTMDGLAAYYGDAFEIVLHDLMDLDHSIIKILNGFHSGRKEGGPITDFALSMLEQIRKNAAAEGKQPQSGPYISYVSASKYGKPVRSTTIILFGERNRAIGMLCINLYLDSPLSSLLQKFSMVPQSDFVTENFINDSNELILRTLEKVKNAVNSDETVHPSLKNKEIVTLLYHQGIFKLKDAVQTVSAELEISKNTVYLHIRSLEEKGKK
ncbi:helix-turn-helix transcriptional regulator [Treponema primitia]|uniref:helix-turn-helix transcriptional regulator n=1 Tax=Treponema primitia TaxID=88058 RepID=UPI000255585E|nr:PAS domain-containing protein [Treponema primitia]